MRSSVIHFLAVLIPAGTLALDMQGLSDERAAALLEKNYIRTDAAGLMPARFDTLAHYLSRPDPVERIQAAYRKSVSKDGTIDCPMVKTGDGTYYYLNEKGRRTDITELYRGKTSDSTYELLYYAAGKRYFGRYEVLVHIRAFAAAPAGTLYTVTVYAYPRNGPLRFLARHLGTVERYFHRKMWVMIRVSEKICRDLNDPLPLIYSPPNPLSPPAPRMSADPVLQNSSIPLRYLDSADPRKHI